MLVAQIAETLKPHNTIFLLVLPTLWHVLFFLSRLHNELDLDVSVHTAGREKLLHIILFGRSIHPRNYNTLHEIVYQFLKETTRFV